MRRHEIDWCRELPALSRRCTFDFGASGEPVQDSQPDRQHMILHLRIGYQHTPRPTPRPPRPHANVTKLGHDFAGGPYATLYVTESSMHETSSLKEKHEEPLLGLGLLCGFGLDLFRSNRAQRSIPNRLLIRSNLAIPDIHRRNCARVRANTGNHWWCGQLG